MISATASTAPTIQISQPRRSVAVDGAGASAGARARARRRAGAPASAGAGASLGLERVEEVVGDLGRRALDEARADLRQLAADLRPGGVGQPRAGALRCETYVGRALAEAGDAALAVEGDGVRRNRHDVLELEPPLEARVDRADAQRHRGQELVVGDPFEGFAAGDASLQRFRFVERCPGGLGRGGDQAFALQVHRECSVRWGRVSGRAGGLRSA